MSFAPNLNLRMKINFFTDEKEIPACGDVAYISLL